MLALILHSSRPKPGCCPTRIFRLKCSRAASSFADSVEDLARQAEDGLFWRKDNSTSKPFKLPTVLLLHPPGACSAFTRSGSQYPPLGLLQLKALIGNTTRVDVLEADATGWTPAKTAEHIRSIQSPAIGMTVTCGTKRLTHAWSTVVKNLSCLYNPVVIVGGPAAAFETPSILEECPSVDAVVKGEGEVTFPKIVRIIEDASLSRNEKLLRLSGIAGVVVREYPNPATDAAIPTVPKEAFQTLPFPDLTSSPVKQYKAPDALRLPMVTMMTQRGCIASCAFCNTPQIHGRSIRGWTNPQIVEELQRLKDQHGIRQVSFVDDVFTNRPGGGPRDLCRRMIEAQLDLTWYCNARADQVTAKMATAMKQAGCHQVFLGFESGCNDMLRSINKGETVADLERGAKILKEAGIQISIGFIVGLPGESDDSVQKSIDLCHRVQPDRVQFTRFTPIPGSALASLNLSHHVDSEEELESLPGKNSHAATSTSFHDRSHHDKVEAWLTKCYAECQFKPSI